MRLRCSNPKCPGTKNHPIFSSFFQGTAVINENGVVIKLAQGDCTDHRCWYCGAPAKLEKD